MVQTIQLLELSSQKDFPRELKERIIDYYEDSLNGSDTYVRYYPNSIIEGLNEWLFDNSIVMPDIEDEYFYILIRIDW